MTRRLTAPDLVLATFNAGKLDELQRVLAGSGLRLHTAAARGLPEPAETGSTYADNAALKALAAARATGLPALGDDSGLEVLALGGFPGLETAREAARAGGWARLVHVIGRAVEAAGPDHRATWRCALALAWPDGLVLVREGVRTGVIVYPPPCAGAGFEPILRLDGEAEVLARLPTEDRLHLHARMPALDALRAECFPLAGGVALGA
jgi:XTP/dITP diphosphohydrolase